jgi:MAF protein
MPHLILASQSPRRRALITLLGLQVQAVTANVDEESIDDPDPGKNVLRTALLKAHAVSAQNQQATVIAADTTVTIDGEMLGKPANAQEAWHMLRRLRGRAHQVHTGLAVLQQRTTHQSATVCTTDVIMRDYSNIEIANYIESDDPFDKAGAYAIQHSGFRPVAQIRGCYCNVVGLPLCQLRLALSDVGIASDLNVAQRTQDYRHCATCRALMDS